MCNFLSGVVTIGKHPKILCQDLMSHDKTITALRLKPETYREWEWTSEDTGDSLDVRVIKGEDANEFKSAILAQFHNRKEAVIECIRQMAKGGRNCDYDLSGCDLNGLTLPTSIGGSLYLRGCDLTGLTLPTSIGGYLDLGGCDLNGLTLPTSIGGSLDLGGCDLNGLTFPTSIGGSLYLGGCDLTGLTLPTSIGGSLYLSGCDLNGLTLPTSIGGSLYLGGCMIPASVRKQIKIEWNVYN